MEKAIVVTGKTFDLAVENALAQLGLERDQVSIQILCQAKPGFLGFGATPAKIQVTYEAPDPVPEAPKAALSAASRSKPKAKAEQPKAEKPVPPQKKQPEQLKKQPEQPKKQEKQEKPAQPVKEKKPFVYTPAQPGSVEEKVEAFLKGLLEQMGSQAVPQCIREDEETYLVHLDGPDLGYLIGRRGDTLDAIQHLCNYAVGRRVEGHIRINVDAEDFRERREESLRRYARKKAQQVLKARRRTTLEPMNAYERHVIHSALQDMEEITTYSVGTEPNRRVVIEFVR